MWQIPAALLSMSSYQFSKLQQNIMSESNPLYANYSRSQLTFLRAPRNFTVSSLVKVTGNESFESPFCESMIVGVADLDVVSVQICGCH
jgi:hypothetical protein